MAAPLQLVLVTPETTLLDVPVQSLQFPLFDGQIGILPARAPMVGRLGCGELTAKTDGGTLSYFIDGGFVQIKGSVVSLLTSRAIPTASLDVVEAEQALQKTKTVKPHTEADFIANEQNQQRARRMLAMAKKK